MLKRVYILTLLLCCCNLIAQIASKPILGFTQVCASGSFNSFPVSFTVSSISSQGAGNEFVIELSDASGGFAAPTVLKSFAATASPINTNISFPTNVYGAGYKIRVKTTNPAKVFLSSDIFAAYYAAYNQSFTVNNGQSVVKLCNGTSVTLTIDGGSNSPLLYSQLSYVWYKDGSVLTGANGASLTVSQPGQYYAQVNYGSCTASYNAYSNLVAVSNTNLTPQIQTSDSSLSICGNGAKQLICSEQNASYVYKWYRNGALISGATSYTYGVTLPGTYKVVVTDGGCSFTSTDITLVGPSVNASINSLPLNLIVPGQQLTLTTSTTALQPSYTWYRNGVEITGQTANSLVVTQDGTYKVIVKQNQDCVTEISAEATLVYPTGFDIGIKNTVAYTQCQSTSASLSNDKFLALAPSGPVNALGYVYGYGYQWFKDGIAIVGATTKTLDISGGIANGAYKLGVTIPDLGQFFSNTVDVQLKITSDIAISNNVPLCTNGDTVVLQSNLTDPHCTYDWYFNGTKKTTTTTGSCTVTQAGTYYLVVKSGACTLQSNSINLQVANFNLSPLATTGLIIPGQQLSLSVFADALQPAYTWYKDAVLINGETSNALNITNNGVYKVVVKQTQGCLIEKSSEITVSYPTGFDLGVVNTMAYTQCQNTSASLSLNKFLALTTASPISILGNNYGYAYQWYKDGVAVSGATGTTLDVSGALSNGTYKLGVTIPVLGQFFSNTIDVQLKISSDITIANNVPLCANGDTVVLQSKLTDSHYTYDWYYNGTKAATNTTGSYTVTLAGNYYLVVKSGACSLQSNTINLQASNINLSFSSSPTLIIPGQQLTLNVGTDAIQPSYTWYKDGVLINGETANMLNITKNGVYKVTVQQTQGCLVEKSSEITVSYPTGFDLGVVNTMAYSQCQNISASLSVDKFSALTTAAPISILGNNYGYAYQWYKDGVAVSGATAITLNVSGELSNGAYKLGVTIPVLGQFFSNTIDIQLKISSDITIANNVPLCANGDTVVLQSKLTDSHYTYDWYFNGTKAATNTTGSYAVTQAGNYYLVVKSGACSLQSNTINLQASNINLSFSSSPTLIMPGQQLTLSVTSDALQPTYTWYKDAVLINGETGTTLNITKSGVYKVAVKQTQGCLIEKSSEITVSYPTGFDLGIKNTMTYAQCQNTSASLSLYKFSALTTTVPISVLGNSYGYAYQWYKDGVIVSGATASTLNISGDVLNGSYKLGVTIPDFGIIFSNTVDVQLKITENIAITNNGLFCKNGDAVTLQSNITTQASYGYDWYYNGSKIATNDVESHSVSQAGDYYLLVKSGACSLQSNTISLKEGGFNVSISSLTSLLAPGQTTILTAVTDALEPSFAWYKDDVLALNQNGSTLQISDPGVYKVIVTQTQGCSFDKSSEITIVKPSDFTITIATQTGYQECKSVATTLKLTGLVAESSLGKIDLTANPYNYTFQWYKDDVILPGEVATVLQISDFTANAQYKLQVIIPGFTNEYSNTVAILLGLSNPVKITQSGFFCDEGSEVVLSSNYTDTSFHYEWFESSSNTIIGTPSEMTVTKSGNYYLKVSSNGCGLVSNTISIKPYSFSQVSIDAPEKFGIVEGGARTVNASGADSYEWYFNNQLVSQGDLYKITQEGTYILIVKVGTCSKTYTFEVGYLENKYIVANTVTPNGDGFNDYWTIPMDYAYRDTVLVTIFDGSGTIIFRTFNYQNNWPDGNLQNSQGTPVYYFTIEEIAGSLVKAGSITIVK